MRLFPQNISSVNTKASFCVDINARDEKDTLVYVHESLHASTADKGLKISKRCPGAIDVLETRGKVMPLPWGTKAFICALPLNFGTQVPL